MPIPLPGPDTRWRCASCGNLTRFDATRSRRTREFIHVDLAGGARVEESETLAEAVEAVTCRWCRSTRVELVPRPGASSASTATPATAGPSGGSASPP